MAEEGEFRVEEGEKYEGSSVVSQPELFARPEAVAFKEAVATRPQEARVRQPERRQVRWEPRELDALLPAEHKARAIWSFLEQLDLSAFYASIKSVWQGPGRPTTDPRVLLALWIQATVDDVSSGRQLARLCQEHDAYRWLGGGVPINYHMLADFRSAQRAALDELLTQIVAALMAAGAVTLERVAQDGMRVRASAGAASFRRREGLEECLRQARERVTELSRRQEGPEQSLTRRQQAAEERAARERVSRVEQALAFLPVLQESKDLQHKRFAKPDRARISEPRASTTDPEARVMKMPDGGFRPAYNLQMATDTAYGVIVGVRVSNSGSDAGQAVPMVEQIEHRTGLRPHDYLVDGGFSSLKDITALTRRGLTPYAPIRQPKSRPPEERYLPHYGDTPEVVDWRQRMSTAAGKEIYRQRAACAEWTNAQVSRHGLSSFNLRGLQNAFAAGLLFAIAHNFLRWTRL